MKYVFKSKILSSLFFVIDSLGCLLVFPFRSFTKKFPEKINNILVIRLDHIGDVLYATTVLQNLREHFKGAKISFLVGSWSKEILQNNPFIDEIICYDAPWFNRKHKKTFAPIEFFKLVSTLKNSKFDLGFDLRGDFRHIALMDLSGIKFKVGYGITGGGFLLSKEINFREKQHAVKHNLDLLRSLDIKILINKPQLFLSKDEEDFINDFYKINNINSNEDFFIIHPYSGNQAKNWSDNKLIEFLAKLALVYKARIVLVGSSNDTERIDKLIKSSNIAAINVSGKINLRHLMALLKKAKLFVGMDSGPAHISCALNTPSLILYSGTNSLEEWAPFNEKTAIINKKIECKGCEKVECVKNVCMDSITTEEVLSAINGLLKV